MTILIPILILIFAVTALVYSVRWVSKKNYILFLIIFNSIVALNVIWACLDLFRIISQTKYLYFKNYSGLTAFQLTLIDGGMDERTAIYLDITTLSPFAMFVLFLIVVYLSKIPDPDSLPNYVNRQ